MPDTILIDGFDEDDGIEVIDKYELDDDIPEDELNESAEFYLDEVIMQTADPQIPVYSMVRELDDIIPKSKKSKQHVTADTIETMIGIEAELMDDDGSELAFLMDTLTGKE